MRVKPLCLIILDGWGIGENTEENAIALAKTPNMDRYLSTHPFTIIGASGKAVGLPEGQMGNSEVGHLNLGAGRIVYQDLLRINKAIKDGSFFFNGVLLEALNNVKKHSSRLHLMGLLSDGGVHSHNTHLYALLEMAKQNGVNEVFLHLFLDGRDVLPKSALLYLEELEKKISLIGIGKITTIVGRYYGMDRDKRWERIELAFEAIVHGEGENASTPKQAVEQSYEQGVVDEFVKPTVIRLSATSSQLPVGLVKDKDAVIFFNFRPDRARQITRAFIEEDFKEFDRGKNPLEVHFVCMTEYDATFKVPVAFPPQELTNVLADVLAKHGLKQLHIAETEKYAHVTFFFNGGKEEPKKGEVRRLIPSPKVATYDLKPEMSAYEVTEAVLEEIGKDIFDVIILNYANPDMVGHTGVFEAAVKAAEAVDECMGKVVEAIIERGGECLITADHGNLEKMIDPQTKGPFTAHTIDDVPFIYVTERKVKLQKGGCLADVAPTMLEILEIPKPEEMTGKSLIV
ncbi:MAG: 2,3-bisphosphoglycerate-independent phosphoglycerate mutase [Candidatus Subteraquimicrobiales bacterium]|nr:2,3-bisphosphoglycerate-independent phosphoglycerate mutase [Candidatus Subteraquimicrobiales bacterium]